MIDFEQEVEMSWSGRNKNWYIDRGYKFTKMKDKFLVKVKDLLHGSGVKVVVICNVCGKENLVKYKSYNGLTNNGTEKYKCKDCALIKLQDGNKRTWEDITKSFRDKGYELISTKDEYKNNKSYLRYICNKHKDIGVQNISLYNIYQNKNNCSACISEARCGENCVHWKGGISNFNNYIRDKLIVWKYDSMKACNYKCVLTGDKFDDIHHLQGLNLILKEVVDESGFEIKGTVGDYKEYELETLVNHVIAKHYEYPLGICLRKDLHMLFHDLYGRGDNTVGQFEEFRDRYNSGEFEEFLSCG